jgi:hypothetical protein
MPQDDRALLARLNQHQVEDALIASKEAAGRDKDPRALRCLRAIKDRPKPGGSAPSQQA